MDDVLLDRGLEMNIIIEDFTKKLGLPIPKTSYTFRMANQTMTRLIRLINNLKIHIHGIPCISTFIMMNIILDDNYSMLLGDIHGCIMLGVTHNWGNNLITIFQGNGIVCTIVVANHLIDNNTKWLEVLLCYDFVNGMNDEKKDVLLEVKPNLFIIKPITLLEPKIMTTTIISLEFQ